VFCISRESLINSSLQLLILINLHSDGILEEFSSDEEEEPPELKPVIEEVSVVVVVNDSIN